MKKTLIICTLTFLCIFSQLSAQDNNDKKISYNMINEYGLYAGNTFGFEGIFINSIKFNNTNDLLGIGLGYSADVENGHGIPMFLNYRHYFDRGKTVKPLFNIAAGATYYFGNYNDFYFSDIDPDYNYYYGYYDNGFGLYATIASGFRAKAFSFTAGFFVRSAPRDFSTMTGGITVKVGYTF